MAEKYKQTERSRVIWEAEGRLIIREFRKDFKNSTPQFKHRVLNIRKFSVEYDEDEEKYYLEAPVKYKNKIRRQPVVFFEQIF